MAEVQVITIAFGSPEILESIEFDCPCTLSQTHNVSSLSSKLSSSLASLPDSRSKRYFVLLFESLGKDEELLYSEMQENPQVISVYYVWNEKIVPTPKIKKLSYIPKGSIGLALSSGITQFLRNEAEKQLKSDQTALANLYLRKAEKTKELVMSNLRVCA